jgi:ATP-dependent helicase/DNAse subunit B
VDRRFRILVGAAGSGKTHRVLEEFTGELGQGGEPLLLLPSSHRVREVKRQLLSQHRPVGLDTIHTMESLVGVLLENTPYAFGVLNAIETQAVVEEVVRSVAPKLRFFFVLGKHWGFTRVVAKFFRDALGCGDFGLEQVQPPEKARDLKLLLGTYVDALEKRGVMDEQMALRRAAELVKAGMSSRARGITRLLVDGFYDFTGAQWVLMETLIKCVPQVTFSLLYDPERSRLFSLPGEVLERLRDLGGQVEELEESRRGKFALLESSFRAGRSVDEVERAGMRGRLFLIKGGNPLDEVRWIAHQTASLIKEGVPPEDIGVVVKSIPLYRNDLEEAFNAWNIPFHITQHPVLAEHPLVNLVVMLMKARMEDLPVNRLVSLALSSLVRVETATRQEILKLVEKVQYLLGISEWKRRLGQEKDFPNAVSWVNSTLIPALEAMPLKGRMMDIMGGMDRSLELLGVGRDGDEERVLSFLREALLWVVKGKSLVGKSEDVTLEEFLSSMGGVLRESHYSSSQSQEGVTIMSLLDARQSFFSHLFFVGLNEGVFPAQVYSDPLLRDGDRERINRAYGRVILPVPADRVLKEDPLLFYIGFTRASERLFLSYSLNDDQGRPLAPSPYLEELLEGVECLVIEGRPPFPLLEGARDPRLEDTVKDGIVLPEVFTPTQIETYANCPYLFFLLYVLGVEPFKVPVEEALNTFIGELYHEVLQLYEEARRGGEGGDIKGNIELMDRMACEVFHRYEQEGKVGHRGLFHAERRRHISVLEEFVRWETEQSFPPPCMLEETLEGEYRGLRLKGRVDRVQEEGAIWDYKVGRIHPYRDRKNRNLLFQPYVYAYLLKDRVANCNLFKYLFLADLHHTQNGVLSLEITQQQLEAALELVVELVGHMKRGLFPVDSGKVGLEEVDSKCRYCSYLMLCRREEKKLGW